MWYLLEGWKEYAMFYLKSWWIQSWVIHLGFLMRKLHYFSLSWSSVLLLEQHYCRCNYSYVIGALISSWRPGELRSLTTHDGPAGGPISVGYNSARMRSTVWTQALRHVYAIPRQHIVRCKMHFSAFHCTAVTHFSISRWKAMVWQWWDWHVRSHHCW